VPDITQVSIAETGDATLRKMPDWMAYLDHDFDPMMGLGYFDVWIDATSLSTPASGSIAASVSRILYDGTPGTFVIDQAGGPLSVGASNGLRWNQTVAGAGSTYRMLETRIEDASTFNADNATLSFYASASVDGVPCTVEIVQFFGSGGSPSSDVIVLSQGITVNSANTVQQFTVSMPSTAAKMFGSNWDDCIKVRVKFPPTSTFTVALQEMVFKRGSVRQRFSQVPLALKHQYLERYIQYHGVSIGFVAQAANAYLYQSLPFKTEMRAVPSVTFFGSNRTNLYASAPENGAPVATYVTTYGASVYIRSASAGVFSALQEIVRLDARL
jgi:hypothetical protein